MDYRLAPEHATGYFRRHGAGALLRVAPARVARHYERHHRTAPPDERRRSRTAPAAVTGRDRLRGRYHAGVETASAGMVGRAVPLAELLHLCAEAGSGRGRAALVVAEAGMGKSTLAEAVASAADGWTVAWGWAAPDAAPYAPWRTALDALLAEHPLSAGYAWAAPPARPAQPESAAARHALFAASPPTRTRSGRYCAPVGCRSWRPTPGSGTSTCCRSSTPFSASTA